MRCLRNLLIILLMISGCATANYRTELLASVSETDRERCEQFAQSEANAITDETAATATGALLGSLIFAKGAPYIFALFGLPAIISEANRVAKARTALYDQTLKACLEPTIIEANLGSEHPDLERSLMSLADRYKSAQKFSEAEQLYQRTLAIQEKLYGPEYPDLANTLEAYASVLARLDRQSEAEEIAARYLEIRNKRQMKELDNEKRVMGQATTETVEILKKKSEREMSEPEIAR